MLKQAAKVESKNLIFTVLSIITITYITIYKQIYGLTAVLLLVGIILFGIFLDGRKSITVITVKTNKNFNEHYASIVSS